MTTKELTEDEKAAEEWERRNSAEYWGNDIDPPAGNSEAFLAGIEHQKSKLRGILADFLRFYTKHNGVLPPNVLKEGCDIYKILADQFLKSEGEI